MKRVASFVLFASIAISAAIAGPFASSGVITSGGGGGSGTVTSVSVTPANGVTGAVANPTTTPAISLTLGAITPTSVTTGTVTTSAITGTPTVVLTNATGLPLSTGVTGTLAASNGGAGATNGILKANGSGLVSAAASGTDYAPATSGTSILKGNGSGGTAAIVSGTDLKTINSTSIIGSGDIAISATPAGSGSELQFRNAGAFGAVTGSSVSGANVTLGGTMTVTQSIPASGTVTVSTPLINGSQLWNAGGVTFTADLINVTDTASATGSLLMDRQIGGTSKFSVLKNGQVVTGDTGANAPSYSFAGDLTTGWGYRSSGILSAIASAGEVLRISTAGADSLSNKIGASNGGQLALGAGGTFDTFIARSAAGVLDITSSTSCGTAANCRDLKLRHILASGTAPTVAGSCGTSPSITGGDQGMVITAGTGSPTSCTVTFGTAYTNAPACTANAATTTTALRVATTTTTVIVSTTALTASEKINVICVGF